MKRISMLLASVTIFAAACGETVPSTPDTTAPVVSTSGPVNAATGVPRNPTVTATFNEAMTPSTINATTFVVMNGATPVAGTVTYAGNVASFVPSATLAANTTFTATISVDAKDVAGNAMAAAKVWTFTTVATPLAGPATVNLGTAGNYVVVAKSAISTTGTTAIVGDLGLSPAAASFVTGFTLTADVTNTFSTSAMVTGKVWAASYTAPTPATLTTVVLDMQAAYTDAAGRTLPDFVELGAGNINGMTLSPGLYKWGTGVSIPIAVTLSGSATDIWIFQIGQNLTVGNGAIVTLTGGAQARNVFWQVAGQATLGTTANFKGTILSQTLISLNTGAVLTGRALAQTAVTLNATTVSNP